MRTGARAAWVAGGISAVGFAAAYRLVVKGALTIDVGIGRRVQPLGPRTISIDAPRELVFEVIAAPYLGNAGRDAAEHVEVLERGSDMVVAAHRTPTAGGLVAMTVESVRLEPPSSVAFRLLRGPVPQLTERLVLEEDGEGTRLEYAGELGTDFWGLGARWGDAVGRVWVRTVERSLEDVRQLSERRAVSARRRNSGGR